MSLIQDMIEACNVPKIAAGEFRHVVDMAKRLLNDTNQSVVISTLKLFGSLAKGLRRSFYYSAKAVLPQILLKLREKKTQLL